MRESHAEAIEYLLIFVAILIFAIAMPFILKAFRKKTSPPDEAAPKKFDDEITAVTDLGHRIDDEITQKIQIPTRRSHEDTQDLSHVLPVPLAEKLKNTKSSLWGRLKSALEGKTETEALNQIEEILFTSDIGPHTVENLIEKVKIDMKSSELKSFESLTKALKNEMSQMIEPLHPSPIKWNSNGPTVFLVLGVNGVGKTTTIGKLAASWASEGKKVLVAAGDTFRAAASSQLRVWSERAQVEIFAPEHTKDPSGVAFEAVQKAVNQKFDVVIVDTAGRLHTQAHLMEEVKKIRRVVEKALPGAPHESWIVLDANSGQNALTQAREFHKAVTLTGAVVTKMDGTAKGGVVIGLHDELKIPVKKIGVGERLEDLRTFNPKEFLDAIF